MKLLSAVLNSCLLSAILFLWAPIRAALGTVASFDSQETSGSAQIASTVSLIFPNPVLVADTVVVMVAYGNSKNRRHITVDGLGATWKKGYAPRLKGGLGIAFFYGSNSVLTNSTLTITTKYLDNLSAFAQDWPDLSNVEDKKARSMIQWHRHNGNVEGQNQKCE
jgi:hypothetical protein